MRSTDVNSELLNWHNLDKCSFTRQTLDESFFSASLLASTDRCVDAVVPSSGGHVDLHFTDDSWSTVSVLSEGFLSQSYFLTCKVLLLKADEEIH